MIDQEPKPREDKRQAGLDGGYKGVPRDAVRVRHAWLLGLAYRVTRGLLWLERRGGWIGRLTGWPVGRGLRWLARWAWGWYTLEVWDGRRWVPYE